MCGMMECGHSPTSLEERARELKLEDISKMIHAASNGKVNYGPLTVVLILIASNKTLVDAIGF